MLGSGSFGKVYLAHKRNDDPNNKKYYAIKEIKKSMLVEYDIIQMVQLES